MEDDSLPYLAEYSKSNRAACKTCKEKIEKGILRLAVIVKSAKFDGKMTSWYHYDCFFVKQRPKTVGDIEHFDQLRWEDQEKIKNKLEELGKAGPPPAAKGKGKKGKAAAVGQHPDFKVEYAKSGRAACRGCSENITKGAIRISKKSYDSENARKYGPQDLWHHVHCFKGKREELEFSESAEAIPGFSDLTPEDQKMLKKELPAQSGKKHKLEPDDAVDGASEPKKMKKEEQDPEIKAEIKKQNEIMYKYRDELEKNLTKAELTALIEYNKQDPPTGPSNMLDLLADIMTFGSLRHCPECKKGQLMYKTGVGYECTGNMSEWTKCPFKTKKPERRSFKCPSELAEAYSFLNKYKYVERTRVIPDLPAKTKKDVPVAGTSEETKVKQEAKAPLLTNFTFVLDSKLEKSKSKEKEIEGRLKKLGGKLGSRISEKVAAVLSAKSKIKDMDKKMERAQELGIQVVPVDILDEFESAAGGTAAFLINKKNIAPWGINVEERITPKESKSGKSSKSKGLPDKMKLKLKGGGVVDPDSGLEDCAHVLKVKETLYSVVLGVVDIQHDRNSYYKLQILESDKGKEWWLFRSWGRVGTTIGDNKLTPVDDKADAIDQFVALYEEKTGNPWKYHGKDKFVKQPNKFYPLDIDYGDTADVKMSSADSKSKLPKAVQDLICMIFDVDNMKRAMVEFELDLTKLPLGKISRKQIEKAYSILSRVEEMLKAGGDVSAAKFVDASNQFYTLIPHDFGTRTPPLLDNDELVKTKLVMLESLLEIEVAYSLLKAGDAVLDKDPIDAHYEKLNTKIEVLDKTTDEFQLLETYVKNTHASTHTQYGLDIEEIFKVERKGEKQRFRPFSKLPNRRLLWHGSRVTNMAGILSQGLRIAPPEAPVTGYMFGKGIYFADMVSKSANYCATTKSNPHGLLLLCDVALGNMYERTQADYIEKLKKEYQSVIGLGKTEPNPEESKMVDKVQVPLGKPQTAKVASTSLLYNEYIVYDVAQVNVKYLLKMKFNYK